MTWSKLLARENIDLTTVSAIDSIFFRLLEEFDYPKELFSVCKESGFTHYIGVDALEWERKIYKKYFSMPTQVKGYYERGQAFLERIERESARQPDKVLDAFETFRAQYEELSPIYSVISWLAIEGWQHDFDEVLNRLLEKNNLGKRRSEVINTITSPWKKTALNEIQERLAAGESPERLAEEFAFLGNWAVVWTRRIDASWVESLRRGKESHRKVLGFEEALALLKPGEEDRRLLELAPFILFFKDWRDDLRRKHAYRWSPLFDRIAQHFGVEHDDLGYLTLDELEESLKKDSLSNATIEQRKIQPAILHWDDGVVVIDEIPQKYRDIINEVEKASGQQQLKGLVAYPGKARGTVRIIRTYHDLKRLEPGDILVSNTTHSNFLPAMQRAAAIVTDEGGLTCHAAIVSRELGKPCVIGTQIASRTLKDGDLVEVDADKGVVRKV